jgi:hypothetical protein
MIVVMILRGSFEERVELNVQGYEFPEAHPSEDWYDANWLRIRLRVHEASRWDALDPSLLTTEARELVRWLRLIAQRRAGEPVLEFIEPCLRFEMREDGDGDWILTLEVSMGLLPNALAGLGGATVRLPLDTDPEALLLAADELEQELDAYPVRGSE